MKADMLLLKEQTILFAEDEKQMREQTAEILEMLAKRVLVAQDGEEAMRIYEEEKPDIILTDVRMPGRDGVSLVRQIRKNDYETPIILLTGFAEQPVLLEAANLSVDGYILKPISLDGIISGLQKAVKRTRRAAPPLELDKGVYYNFASKELFKNGQPLPLGAKESALLQLLVERHPRTVSKEEIGYRLDPMEHISDSAIKNLVFHIRKKVESDLIVSVRGIGYKLNAASVPDEG